MTDHSASPTSSALKTSPLDSTKLAKGDNPENLLRLFSILSVCSVVAILILAGFGIYRVYSDEMIHVAEETAVYVGNSIFEQERKVLLKGSAKLGSLAVSADDFGGLDERMKTFLRTFNMYKIKTFSADKVIIYSTDQKIIGKVEGENHRLDAVLSTGQVISELEKKEKIRDLKGEERFNLDVVECYVPIRGGAGGPNDPIVGAFEVYVDITTTHQRVLSALKGTLSVLGLVLVGVFGLLFLPMRKGMKQLKHAQNVLHELASTDALTGIFNRRHLLNRLQEERARMLRHGEDSNKNSIAYVMVDIDYFKKVNDTHGHLAGDHVLREVSSRIKESLRLYDTLGRYGGEEFLAVLPHTLLDEAIIVAERIRANVCATPVVCEEISLTVTVSIGVAATRTPDEEIAHSINRADEGLYKAKRNGRNQVCALDQDE